MRPLPVPEPAREVPNRNPLRVLALLATLAVLALGVVCHIDSLRCSGFESDYTVANR